MHLVRCHLVEDHQQTAHEFIRIMAHRDDDASVGLSCGEVALCKRLKFRTILRDKRFLVADRIAQLSRIIAPKLTSIACREHRKTTRADEIGHKHIDIFVEIEFNEELAHGTRINGSMRSSGMRLRSIYELISSWLSL